MKTKRNERLALIGLLSINAGIWTIIYMSLHHVETYPIIRIIGGLIGGLIITLICVSMIHKWWRNRS